MSRLAVLYHITRDLSIRKSQSCLQQDGLDEGHWTLARITVSIISYNGAFVNRFALRYGDFGDFVAL